MRAKRTKAAPVADQELMGVVRPKRGKRRPVRLLFDDNSVRAAISVKGLIDAGLARLFADRIGRMQLRKMTASFGLTAGTWQNTNKE